MSVILATAGYDHKIRFWEAPSGINSRTIRFRESQVNCLEITPNKQYLATAGNPQIRLFEINDTSSQTPVLSLNGHTSSVKSLFFRKYLYSGSEDGTIKLWDLRSPSFSLSFNCKAPVNSVALHPTKAEIISGDTSGSVKVWELNSNKYIHELLPDAHIPSGSELGVSPASKVSSSIVNHERASIQAVDISQDGETCVAANNHADVFIWNPCNSQFFRSLAKFRAHPVGTYLLKAKISPECRHLVTTSSDRTARLWDISHHQNNNNSNLIQLSNSMDQANNILLKPSLSQTLAQHTKWVWDAVFSADSSYLVTASSDHTARLWNLRTGEAVRRYIGHQSSVTCVALNDNSL